MKTIDAMKKLSEWHSKTAKLWPTGMDQSTFHNQAAITLHDAISREEAQTVDPVAKVGDSKFESWFSELPQSGKGSKQIAREAYEAGMNDRPAPPPSGERSAVLKKLRQAHKNYDGYWGELSGKAADALQASESAAAERDVLQALSVTNILLEVAPGEDGGGLEIYAKSVDDVVQLLTKLGVGLEDAQGEVWQLRAKLAALEGQEAVGARYKGFHGEWIIGHIQDKEKAVAAGCEFLYLAAGAAQPVSAVVPDVTSAMMNVGANLLQELQSKMAVSRSNQEICRLVYEVMTECAPQPPAPSAVFPALPITESERDALTRFCETCEDGQDYDVPKAMMRRLAEIGLVRRVTRDIYEVTEFGALTAEYKPMEPPAPSAKPLPLTPEEVGIGYDESDIASTDTTESAFDEGIRFAESFHGITQEPT